MCIGPGYITFFVSSWQRSTVTLHIPVARLLFECIMANMSPNQKHLPDA